jgi:type II secretory pathway pseudopilin PulG
VSTPGDYSGQGGPPQKGSIPVWIIYIVIGGFVLVLGLVLAVLGLYGLRKYIERAKAAEARSNVAQLGRDAVAAYEVETPTATGSHAKRLCPSASKTVPERLEEVTGRRYQSAPSEWETDKSTKSGFSCLKFAMSSPQYYLYGYRAHGAFTTGDGFEATAHGDIDGDGVTSDFKLTGEIGTSGALVLAPRIVELNPAE